MDDWRRELVPPNWSHAKSNVCSSLPVDPDGSAKCEKIHHHQQLPKAALLRDDDEEDGAAAEEDVRRRLECDSEEEELVVSGR